MRFGFRVPNFRKSLSARTTGQIKRKIKKLLIPGYGKKGMGWINKPKRMFYNKIYNKTTTGCLLPTLIILFLTIFLLS